jgi:hypothetical protein
MFGGVNAGQMVGFSHEDGAVVDQAFVSGNFEHVTLYVTDYGHRLNWICMPANKIVFENGETLKTLETSDNEKFMRIMNRRVEISMSTHPNKKFLMDFAWKEYGLLNTTQTPHSTGELFKALPRSGTRDQLENDAKALIVKYFPKTVKKPREQIELMIGSTVNGVAHTMEAFNGRTDGDNNVLDVAKEDITPENNEKATIALKAFGEIEQALEDANTYTPSPHLVIAENAFNNASVARKTAPKVQKALLKVAEDDARTTLKQAKVADKNTEQIKETRRKLLKEREYDHAHIGPILYGLSNEPATAKIVYKLWMEKALQDKDTWKNMWKSVLDCKGEGNTARYYNEIRCIAGWTRMKSAIE